MHLSWLRVVFVLWAGAVLAGCQPFPVTLTASGPQQTATETSSQINSFRASWYLAYDTVPNLSANGTAVPATVTGAAAIARNNQYLNSGLSLIDTNCKDYFREEGKLQQAVNVFRDITNALAPVAAGGLALESASAKGAAIVSLAQAGAVGVINTVYSDFLFDSSNIDDVQKLVDNALSADEIAVRANLSNAPDAITYEWVTNQLLSHQAICLPAHILSLARAAIGAGTVVAVNSGTAGLQSASGKFAPGVLAPSVAVSVAPSANALPPPTLTVAAKTDVATTSLLQCIFPHAVKMDANGVVDANGKTVAADQAAYKRLQAWMAENRFKDGTAVLLTSPADAGLRAAAAKQVCNQ